MATAWFLKADGASQHYLNWFKPEVEFRLKSLYEGLSALNKEGYPIEVIEPQGAIYLTVRIPWKDKMIKTGEILHHQKDVTRYLLDTCKVALVPFKAFGSSDESEWYRLSVGTLRKEDIPTILEQLRAGMDQFVEISN